MNVKLTRWRIRLCAWQTLRCRSLRLEWPEPLVLTLVKMFSGVASNARATFDLNTDAKAVRESFSEAVRTNQSSCRPGDSAALKFLPASKKTLMLHVAAVNRFLEANAHSSSHGSIPLSATCAFTRGKQQLRQLTQFMLGPSRWDSALFSDRASMRLTPMRGKDC